MSCYRDFIVQDLAKIGQPDVNPAHVEAWMRLECGTLNSLTPARFRREVKLAAACVAASTPEENASLAESFGLR